MTRHTTRRRDLLKAIGAGTAVGMTGLAGCLGDEGDFPAEPLSAIIPFDEGGGSDTIIRQMAEPLSEELGEEIQIENVPGAGAMRGIGQLITAESDGYTFGKFNPLTTSIQAMINPPDFEYQDLKGLATIGSTALTVVTHADHEVEDFDDLRDRYQDGEFENFGGLGAQYLPHAMTFKEEYGVDWNNYIQYTGAGPINQAIASGEIPAAVNADVSSTPIIDDGSGNVTAVLTTAGSTVFPDVPDLTDQGYDPMDALGQITRSMWVPPGVPDEELQVLTEAVEVAVQSDSVQEFSEESGIRMAYGPPEEADDILESVWEDIPAVVDIEDLREAAD